jgi:hypothetical protein
VEHRAALDYVTDFMNHWAHTRDRRGMARMIHELWMDYWRANPPSDVERKKLPNRHKRVKI